MFITQQSTTFMVVLESGMDISTLEINLDVLPGKKATLKMSIAQHPSMLDPDMITPDISCEVDEVLNCTQLHSKLHPRKDEG